MGRGGPQGDSQSDSRLKNVKHVLCPAELAQINIDVRGHTQQASVG